MGNKQWKFRDPPNVMVLTTKDVANRTSPILVVGHNSEDGMWEFLDENEIDENELMIVGLEEIVNIDDSIEELYDLPIGWVAWRDNDKLKWKRQVAE